MGGADSKEGTQVEEPVVTKLISSKERSIPPVEAWKLSRFDQKEQAEEAVLSQRVSQEVKKKIAPELEKRTELLKKEAYDSAYQKGYEEGLASGSEEGRLEAIKSEQLLQKEAFEPKMQQISELILGLENPYKELQTEVLSELVELALHVAHEVIQKELSGSRDWILKAIQEAVKVLPDDSQPYSVELHPDDIALLKEGDSALIADFHFKSNSNITPGSCLVQQQNTSVLNSWKERYDELSTSLLSKASS